MKFIVSWTVPQGTYNATIARFLETGGAPLEGVEMLGRWHGMTLSHGVAIAETSDANALYLWQAQSVVADPIQKSVADMGNHFNLGHTVRYC